MADVSAVNWSEKVSDTLFTGLGNIRESGNFSDVTIEVEEHKFPCHKAILSSMSGYFKSMFTAGFQEAGNGGKELKLQEVEQNTFCILLDIIYTGKNLVTVDNVETILQAAMYFQMDFLIGQCQQILLAKITPSNCLRLLNLARQCNCKELETKAEECFSSKFTEVIDTPEFLNLSAEDLHSCITLQSLSVDDEEVVCDAVFKWFLHDLETRKLFSNALLPVLRLPKTSSAYLLEINNKYPSIKKKVPQFDQYVEAALKYHLMPAKRKEYNTLQTDPRWCSQVVCLPVLINCKAVMKDEVLGNVRLYSTSPDKLIAYIPLVGFNHSLSSIPPSIHEGFSCCSYGEDILYIMGGQSSDGKCFKYNGILNTWTPCRRMPESRFDHSACAIGRHVYVFGGCQRKSQVTVMPCSNVAKFDVQSEDWEISDIYVCQVVRKPMLAAMDDKLYAFGGKKIGEDDDQHLDVVQCFDPRTSTCTIIDMGCPGMGTFQGVLNFEGHIYIVTLKDKKNVVFKYDAHECVEYYKLDGEARHGFGIYQKHGSLYLVGGFTKKKENNRAYCDFVWVVPLDRNDFAKKLPITKSAGNFYPYNFQIETLTVRMAFLGFKGKK